MRKKPVVFDKKKEEFQMEKQRPHFGAHTDKGGTEALKALSAAKRISAKAEQDTGG